jgi:hypothetical protein
MLPSSDLSDEEQSRKNELLRTIAAGGLPHENTPVLQNNIDIVGESTSMDVVNIDTAVDITVPSTATNVPNPKLSTTCSLSTSSTNPVINSKIQSIKIDTTVYSNGATSIADWINAVDSNKDNSAAILLASNSKDTFSTSSASTIASTSASTRLNASTSSSAITGYFPWFHYLYIIIRLFFNIYYLLLLYYLCFFDSIAF